MELGEVPEHLIVLGGGFIGLEFGQMFRRFGSEVTVVERGPRLAGREDADIAEAIEQILREDGITIHTAAEIAGVSSAAGVGVPSSCGSSRRASNPPCTFGSSVLTRPDMTSGESVYFSTRVTGTSASTNVL